MNCQDTRNQILLAHSGELPAAKTGELRKHIDQCADCRQYQSQLDPVFTRARAALPTGTPAPAVISTIMNEARRVQQAPRPWGLPLHFSRVLAYAAAAMILAGGLILANRQGHLGRIEEVNAILVVVGEKQLPPEPAAHGKAGKDHELNALARELIRMEGLGTDDTWADPSPVMERGEPAPTTLQFHSTGADPQQTCG
jgi:hypothetical protein